MGDIMVARSYGGGGWWWSLNMRTPPAGAGTRGGAELLSLTAACKLWMANCAEFVSASIADLSLPPETQTHTRVRFRIRTRKRNGNKNKQKTADAQLQRRRADTRVLPLKEDRTHLAFLLKRHLHVHRVPSPRSAR